MNNKLIITDGFWYKIKLFFNNLFRRKNKKVLTEQKNIDEIKNDTTVKIQDSLKVNTEQQELAQKLLYMEIGPSELEETQVDEMVDYFKKDIENIDNELLRIKQHILVMKQKLEQ